VFDAFYSTKTKGTGLGMAIVKRIVEAHQGTVAVGESEQGAEFVITLPRAAHGCASTEADASYAPSENVSPASGSDKFSLSDGA
jgi:nitrogen-specific signal transduction histidine kinase